MTGPGIVAVSAVSSQAVPPEAVPIESVSDQASIALYLVYAAIAVGLVVWLARTLYRNGQVFLADVFEGEDMARVVNHLLVIGFYLLNLGYALLLYEVGVNQELTAAFNDLVAKLGLLLLSLGVIHFTNMFVFWRIRTYRDRRATPLPPPAHFIPPPPAPTPVGS